jgi:uncharacterized protein YbgA (DUF1722 family)/uncharacterized protein YbbK (DUF523 family)
MEKIPVGISSCLLGQPVRYDGGHKHNSYIEQSLGRVFDFHPFCPEMASGMGAPRPAIQLRNVQGVVRAVGVKNPTMDVTEDLRRVSVLQHDWLGTLCGYIVKKDSPSCGMTRVKVYTGETPVRQGVGVFAAYMQQTFPELPVEDEGRLGDPGLRENFVRRVFVFERWRRLTAQGMSVHDLMSFHSQHKLIAMSHNQNAMRELGRLAASARAEDLPETAARYFAGLMACLKVVATRGNHVNVLQHIQGYLKTTLDSGDKQELCEVIESYRLGLTPLIVPITLLRHHFRKQPDAFIDGSYYMTPHPGELALLNEI